VVLGVTIPQWRSFWGAPWLVTMIGAEHIGVPTEVEACQTGPRSAIAEASDRRQ
jgi:hypothetical protein